MEQKKGLPTLERLRQLLIYEPATGIFYWAIERPGIKKGSRAGTVNPQGYEQVGIDRIHVLSHRLAWFYMYGEWPEPFIDHINGVRNDNRLSNLRVASRAENSRNYRKQRKSKNRYKGVSYCSFYGKYVANIQANGKRKFLGYFADEEEARSVYVKAAKELHGEFAHDGENPLI